MLDFISPSYATDAKGATVLDHKSWVSGSDKKGTVISGHLERNTPIKKNSLKSTVNTTASTSNVSGAVYQNIYTSGHHSYRIDNASSQPQIYTVHLSLCANSSLCFNDQSHVRVTTGGHFYDDATSRLTCSFIYPGNYSLEAKTGVSADNTSYARDTATINIRK